MSGLCLNNGILSENGKQIYDTVTSSQITYRFSFNIAFLRRDLRILVWILHSEKRSYFRSTLRCSINQPIRIIFRMGTDNNILSQVGINGDKCCFPFMIRVCNQNISIFLYLLITFIDALSIFVLNGAITVF